MRTRLLLPVAGIMFLLAAATAASGSGPSPGVSFGSTGLTHGNERYVTVIVRDLGATGNPLLFSETSAFDPGPS